MSNCPALWIAAPPPLSIIGDNGEAEKPPIENSAPDIADVPGEAVVPSNGIDSANEEKQTAKEAEQETPVPEAEAPAKKGRGGRPPKGNKEAASVSAGKEETAPVAPEPPRDATRPGETETIVYINHDELHPFKGHPFQVRDDDAMKALVESVKERGIDQPAPLCVLVRAAGMSLWRDTGGSTRRNWPDMPMFPSGIVWSPRRLNLWLAFYR